MEILAGGATDTGRVRSTNEDAFLVDAELGLFAVADGMGGHAAGEVASHLALETLHAHVSAASERPAEEVLAEGIRAASTAIVEHARADRSKSQMGTTVTALLVRGDRATLGHVGDSRLYRVRWGEVDKLTQDHTAAAELVRAGAISEADAPAHPWAHILSRVVGREGPLDVEVATIALAPGDRFLLCSDGFSDSLSDPRWLADLEPTAPDVAARLLVARAVELDGRDNATAVVVVVGAAESRRERRSSWKRLRTLVSEALDELLEE